MAHNVKGFELLNTAIYDAASDLCNTKIGLEAISLYSYNIVGFMFGKDWPPTENAWRKSNVSLLMLKIANVASFSVLRP